MLKYTSSAPMNIKFTRPVLLKLLAALPATVETLSLSGPLVGTGGKVVVIVVVGCVVGIISVRYESNDVSLFVVIDLLLVIFSVNCSVI